MKSRLLYLLTSILIVTSLVQCTDSVTGETKNIEASQPIKPDDKSLPAPTQISPDAGADDVSLKPTFKWEAVDGADSYILHVSAKSQMVIEEQVEENTYTPANKLFSKANQSWRIRAVKDGKKGKWSEIQIFSTGTSTNSGKPSGSTDGSISTDRAALMDLYAATGGDHWDNNSGWGSGKSLGKWYGIETNGQGRVTRVDLWHNNLEGHLPASIGNLDKVKYLNVKYNHLSGSIPSEIGNMSSLEVLILQGRSQSRSGGNYVIGSRLKEPPLDDWTKSYHQGKYYSNTNNFSGQIPTELGNLSNLIALELSNAKKIVGPIPSEFGNLSNLKGLYLSGCDFRGYEIPSSIGNLTNLKQIYIEGAGLIGDLPSSFKNLTQLTQVNLGGFDSETDDIMGNQLTGSIPDLSNFTELRLLVINKNNLTGKFPDYFNNGNFTYLHTLSLSHNNLTGKIPHFTNLPRLTAFSIEYNNMTGDVSRLIEVSKDMKILSVGWNNIGGTFPQSGWPDFHQLKTVRLNSNSISGNIPCSFWRKLDNSKLNVSLFGSMPNIDNACPTAAKAMKGGGSIRMSLP